MCGSASEPGLLDLHTLQPEPGQLGHPRFVGVQAVHGGIPGVQPGQVPVHQGVGAGGVDGARLKAGGVDGVQNLVELLQLLFGLRIVEAGGVLSRYPVMRVPQVTAAWG